MCILTVIYTVYLSTVEVKSPPPRSFLTIFSLRLNLFREMLLFVGTLYSHVFTSFARLLLILLKCRYIFYKYLSILPFQVFFEFYSRMKMQNILQLYGINKKIVIFIALHGMQTRSSDENSVCPSVCPSNA